jgi:hypothetical protein
MDLLRVDRPQLSDDWQKPCDVRRHTSVVVGDSHRLMKDIVLGEGARWENSVTMRSTGLARMYEPGVWASRVSPTPLLMIVASHDTITLTDLALASYEQAFEPKKLVLIPGGHFDPYLSGFQISCGAAVDWFRQHLDR